MRRILTIDGGGVRGIIPAVLVADLERRTGRPARETSRRATSIDWGTVLSGRDMQF